MDSLRYPAGVEPTLVARRLALVRARIAAAARRAGRAPEAVRLVAVSKTQPVEALVAAWQAGVTDFGENRVQEAQAKLPAARERGVAATWHLVGHLQSNKARDAVQLFDILQSVDSLRCAEAVARAARAPMRVLLEVNVAGEATKYGFPPGELPVAYRAAAAIPELRVEGLMTVAPQVPDPKAVRPLFRQLRRLAGELGLRECSMGMTDDFEVAIEEGATMVRIGRAIFGPRA